MNLDDYQPQPELSRATTLPGRWYVDPELLELEKSRVFWRTWQPVGRAEQVARPGDFLAAEVLGEPVLVVRGSDGLLRAFSNVCRHRASVVASGHGNCRALRCPYHGWTYALDGRLLGAPEFEGVADWQREKVALPALRVETLGPFVLVNLDPAAPALAEFLGAIPGEVARLGCPLEALRFHSRRDYVVECNWKVYVDNFLEGYHVPVAHPSLDREIDYGSYRVETRRWHSLQHAPLRPARPGAVRRYEQPLQGDGALYYWVFPNFMLNIYPDNLSSNLIVPLSPERTLTVFEWFFAETDAQKLAHTAARTIAFSDEIQKEDIALCESVQRGLRSRSYDRGRLSLKRENGVHHFHLLLHAALSAAGGR